MKSKIIELLEKEEGLFIETLINNFSSTEETIIEFADTEDEEEPTLEQLKACEFILNNSNKIVSSIKQYIYNEREVLEDVYNSYGLATENYFDLSNSWDNITIEKVIIHSDFVNEVSYYGITGECQWDEEHGFGVTMLNEEVIEFGDWCTGAYGYGINDDEKNSLAEKYGLEELFKRKKRLEKLAENIEEKNLNDYVSLFDWLVAKRAIYGYRSTDVNLNSKEKAAFIRTTTYLDLMNKKIERLPSSFDLLQKLSGLSLDDNLLEEIPKCIERLTSLESIGLSNNVIKIIPENLKLSNQLKSIYIRNNKLKEIDLDDFRTKYPRVHINF